MVLFEDKIMGRDSQRKNSVATVSSNSKRNLLNSCGKSRAINNTLTNFNENSFFSNDSMNKS